MTNNKTFKYVQIGIYAALIIIAITFIHIPMPSAIANTFVHPGNALVILSALLMGFKRGAIASAIGLYLYDAMNGYLHVAHFTVLENLIVLMVLSFIYHYIFKKDDSVGHIVTMGIIGAVTKVVLIFFKYIINQLLIGANFSAAIAIAISAMPASVFTAIVTAVLVPLLYFPMKQIFQRYHTIGE